MPSLPITIQIEDFPTSKEMSALTRKERAFVYALVETGGNATQAALSAGYGENSPDATRAKQAAAMAGHRLLAKKDVLLAIKIEAQKRLESGALIAASALIEMAQDPESKFRLKAAVELLNRSGLIVPTVQKIDVTHTYHGTDAETIKAIHDVCGRLGLDPVKLLGSAGIVDAEFEEVTAADPVDPDFEGLEDML